MTSDSAPMTLSVQGISKAYKAPLFESVSFTLAAGEGLGILGHNGCGKTTLLDIIAGIQKPDAGTVVCYTPVGYVMQSDSFQDALSCQDNLRLEAALCGFKGRDAQERIQRVAAQCDTLGYLKKRLSKCSAGMRARISIAAALLPAPGLLLLDEAFSALDIESQARIKSLLTDEKARGMSLVMVSHNRDDFNGLCENILTLSSAGRQ